MSAKKDLTIGVIDLLRQPGTRREVTRSLLLDGLAISTAVVPGDEPIDLDLVVEAQGETVIVTGSITTPWVGECRRCLNDVPGRATSKVREIFERRPVEGETYPLANETIDLEQMVRDAVLLALPLAPLCADDCLGPAPDVFPATVEQDEPDDESEALAPAPRATDPRWSGLDQLKFD